MYAYQGNLLDPNDPDPREFASFDFQLFDIAVVGLGFHHFDDPALAAKRLVERLRPGGVLLILDFLPHGKIAHVSPSSAFLDFAVVAVGRLQLHIVYKDINNWAEANRYEHRTTMLLRTRSRIMASRRSRSRRSSTMLAPGRTSPWRLSESPLTRPLKRGPRKSVERFSLLVGPRPEERSHLLECTGIEDGMIKRLALRTEDKIQHPVRNFDHSSEYS